MFRAATHEAVMGELASRGAVTDVIDAVYLSAVRELGLANIHIVQGDGGDGLASNAPYDRAIFMRARTICRARSTHSSRRAGCCWW